MNTKTVGILIIALIILVAGLLVWYIQPNQPITTVSEPTATAMKVHQPTPSQTPTTINESTATPSTEQKQTPTIKQTLTKTIISPTPITRAEQIAKELAEVGGQFTVSREKCGKILQTEDWCGVVKSVKRISQPEWNELFPKTEFYLVKRDMYGGEFEPQQRNLLIVEQDGQRYGPESFDQLLDNNAITINSDNRELIAKALVLMILPDHLENEIVFSEWGEDDVPAAYGLRFNYGISTWTELQGLKLRTWFLFENEYLLMVEGSIKEHNVGNYIESLQYLSVPNSSLSYSYRKK